MIRAVVFGTFCCIVLASCNKRVANSNSAQLDVDQSKEEGYECTESPEGKYLLCVGNLSGQIMETHDFYVIDQATGKEVYRLPIVQGFARWHDENRVAYFSMAGYRDPTSTVADDTYIYDLRTKMSSKLNQEDQ